ncbi:uncharacterized protein PHACADRAFT_196320 [Phanerochaete carnosa HHB-10118-sp]|uniref:Uncharacterized protein n=1 Tax=Phanerochaete carnosa (strain HHB-10118-sp) TaxID=650164 RepID=K5VR00_PHACS|nr:uncharacterized protein PHACADRAFT_196320 [Phanerochaete carnosa HHB-10118-sp]EKM53878.1 hypothetical protein PHACADRAFT_196320 [Phanerochaete carnosa HHB-10118-sp]
MIKFGGCSNITRDDVKRNILLTTSLLGDVPVSSCSSRSPSKPVVRSTYPSTTQLSLPCIQLGGSDLAKALQTECTVHDNQCEHIFPNSSSKLPTPGERLQRSRRTFYRACIPAPFTPHTTYQTRLPSSSLAIPPDLPLSICQTPCLGSNVELTPADIGGMSPSRPAVPVEEQ